jgi:hypothetical protein
MPFDYAVRIPRIRNSFLKFLEADGSDALLRFMFDVEKLRRFKLKSNTLKKYELANKIYENYLKNYNSPVRDEIGNLYKSMQSFLIGDNVRFL